MTPLGLAAPEFELEDVVSGRKISLNTYSQHTAFLVMFICRHCPYVKHVQNELARLGSDYENTGLGIVAISSNDAEAYPDDAPESLREMAQSLNFRFAFCYDRTQEVAKAYGAVCTPDFFVFDRDRKLAYRGRLDGSRPRSTDPVTGDELRAAIDALLQGRPVNPEQWPSMGCNIKWRT
jgi:peroxiredoxin